MEIKQEQGRIIKALREQQNITQEELAYRSDISIDAIRQLERGVKLARMDTMFKLCKGLNIKPENLYNPLWEQWLK